MRFGIYGATSTYDFGDNAMMIKNIEDIYGLRDDAEFVIFGYDIETTRYHCELFIKDEAHRRLVGIDETRMSEWC